MSIKQMDQTNWVCYRFGESSYYYGEVGLLDKSGIVHSKDNVQMAAQAKLVKHGFGVYIYDDPEGKIRYEGKFFKGQKSGKGILYLRDGSKYQGSFKDNQYHDNGIMKYANGSLYDGRWKKGRMDGPGLFKRDDGLTLKGSFKNNYLIDGNVLRNPFMSDEEYQQLKKKRKQIHKQYQKNEKAKNGYFQRVSSLQDDKFIELTGKSWKNNRIPFIVASEQANKSIQSLCSLIEKAGKIPKIIDLRKFHKCEQGEQKFNYKKSITQLLQNAIKQGHFVILSLDDSPDIQDFKQIFYPQIKQLYQPNGFNQLIWSPRDLKKAEIRQKIVGKQCQIHENYGFLVWSKIKLSQQGTTDGFLREKLEKRFDSVLPYIKIDIIYLFEDMKKSEDNKQENQAN